MRVTKVRGHYRIDCTQAELLMIHRGLSTLISDYETYENDMLVEKATLTVFEDNLAALDIDIEDEVD